MYYNNFEITEENGKHFIAMDGEDVEVGSYTNAIDLINDIIGACALSGTWDKYHRFYRTSKAEPVDNGLVDFIADGIMVEEENGEVYDVFKVKIGYGKPVSLDDYWENEATHLFILDTETAVGNYAVKQAIELRKEN